jgi:hypothetical protein
MSLMKKPHRIFYGAVRTILIIFFTAMILVTAIFIWNLTDPLNSRQDNPIVEDPKESRQTFTFSIDSYTLYSLDELDFDFLLATINVESNQAINLSLSHFDTNELIKLNSVDYYLKRFEDTGYFFQKHNVVFSLVSPNTSLQATLFIPIRNQNASYVDLTINLAPQRVLRFDLNQALIGSSNDFGKNIQDFPPEMIANIEVLFKSTVSTTEFYQLDNNGNRIEANFTSQSQIIGVKLTIENISSIPFRLTKAVIKSKSANFYDAVDDSYRIDGINNLSAEYITNKAEGYLFFEILGQDLSVDDFIEIDIYFSSTSDDRFYTLDLNWSHP